MSPAENIEFIKKTMDAFMSGNLGALLAAITDDAIIKAVIPDGTPISGHFQGRDGFIRYITALQGVMEILAVETTDYTASETSVVVLGSEKARVRRTGAMLDCEIATIFTLRDGKIAKMVAMADMTPIVDAYRIPPSAAY